MTGIWVAGGVSLLKRHFIIAKKEDEVVIAFDNNEAFALAA